MIDDLFRSSPVARGLLGFHDHRFVSVNPAWERLFGYTVDEVRGKTGAELGTWAEEVARGDFVARIGAARQVAGQLARRRRRNGEVFEALMANEEFEYAGERYHLTTIVDVSAQARAFDAAETLAAVFRSSPVAHCIVDAQDACILEVNEAYAKMFGLPREAFAGRTGRELGVWPDDEEYERAYRTVRASERGGGYVGKRRRRSGELFDVSMSWESIELNGRRYWLYSLLDVTAELAGRRSMEQLSRFFRSSPAAHLISRLDDGRYVEVNEAYERMFGYRRDEVVGRTSLERGVWFEPGARSAFAKRIRDEGRIVGARIRTRRKDGSAIDVSFSAETIELEGVPHLLVSIEDVTAETRAHAAEELLATFFQSSPAAHVISRIDDGRLLEVNQAWERIYGFSREEAIGRTTLELGVWADPAQRERLIELIGREKGFVNERVPSRRKDGKRLDLLISAEAIERDGEKLLLSSVVDFTAEAHAQEAVRQMNETLEQRVRERTSELEAANRELEAFSYSVSHDMRAPIRAIAGFSGILLTENGSELSADARRLLERIAGSAEHMGALIDALLELSRLMRRPLERERVDLSEIAARLVREVRARFPERAVRTVVHPGLTAVADPVLVQSVLDNLIGNAWKYTSKMPAASIEFGRENGAFFVRDNGVGFDMAYVGKLFKPFERLHSAGEFPGTGIGLATVDRILRRHGGRARAEGAPGRGATVYFTLPE
jgi:PAS domain S-box-containing protein